MEQNTSNKGFVIKRDVDLILEEKLKNFRSFGTTNFGPIFTSYNFLTQATTSSKRNTITDAHIKQMKSQSRGRIALKVIKCG